jgi:hypothetical protein
MRVPSGGLPWNRIKIGFRAIHPAGPFGKVVLELASNASAVPSAGG